MNISIIAPGAKRTQRRSAGFTPSRGATEPPRRRPRTKPTGQTRRRDETKPTATLHDSHELFHECTARETNPTAVCGLHAVEGGDRTAAPSSPNEANRSHAAPRRNEANGKMGSLG